MKITTAHNSRKPTLRHHEARPAPPSVPGSSPPPPPSASLQSAMAAQTEPKREADPTRIRIAAMAVSAVSSTRSSSPSKLPRLLYSKSH